MARFGLRITYDAPSMDGRLMTQVVDLAQRQINAWIYRGYHKLRVEDEPFIAGKSGTQIVPGAILLARSEDGPGTTLTWDYLNTAMMALRICALNEHRYKELRAALYVRIGMVEVVIGRMQVAKCIGTLRECSRTRHPID